MCEEGVGKLGEEEVNVRKRRNEETKLTGLLLQFRCARCITRVARCDTPIRYATTQYTHLIKHDPAWACKCVCVCVYIYFLVYFNYRGEFIRSNTWFYFMDVGYRRTVTIPQRSEVTSL